MLTARPDPSIPDPNPGPQHSAVSLAGRYIVGYLIAAGVASFAFSALTYLVDYFSYMTKPSLPDLAWRIVNATGFIFVLGAVFGIPYTVLATLAFKRWLPQSIVIFLALGAIAPMAAALLLVVLVDGLHGLNGSFFETLSPSLPAGLIGAWLYGAIGMGYGFGRWRMG